MSDIGEWFRSIPQVTKWWFTGSVAGPLLGRLGVLSFYYMVLDYTLFIHHFQIWRPVSALFYYPITPQTGFHFLMNLYFLYSYSTRLETGVFDGRPADFLFMLIFNWICLVIVGLLAGLRLLMDCMVLAVLYIWCQINKDEIVYFWFGTSFKAMYLPWVLLIFKWILGGSGFLELLGILVGHLYFFLAFKYPQEFGGRRFIQTPDILYRYLPNRSGGVTGFGMPPASRRQANNDNQGGHRWGRGQRLG